MAVDPGPSIFAQAMEWFRDLDPLFKVIGAVGTLAGLWSLRPGTVKMSRPAMLSFDADGSDEAYRTPRISFHAALYSTASRHRIIEHMYAELVRTVEPSDETKLDTERFRFNTWRCDGKDAAGLSVGPQGRELNHEFLLPSDAGGATFHFFEGRYTVRIFATLPGRLKKKTVRLGKFELVMSRDDFFTLADHGSRIDKSLVAVAAH